MSENQAQYAATGASRSHEAEINRERIKATLEHTFPAVHVFLANGEPTPRSGDPLCELADDAAALAELMTMFLPDAPEQSNPKTTALVSWLAQRLHTTGHGCRSWRPDPVDKGEAAAVATAVPSSTHTRRRLGPSISSATRTAASTATRRRRRFHSSSSPRAAVPDCISAQSVTTGRASTRKARISWS